MDTPVQRDRPVGYVPLVGVDEGFRGSCGSSGVEIRSSISRSSSGIIQKIHKCASYNTTNEESSGIVCTESGCLYNTLSGGCDKNDIFIEEKTIARETSENTVVPMCLTFSDRKYSGSVDWRRIAEGGYGYLSNAPYDFDATPSERTSGPRTL